MTLDSSASVATWLNFLMKTKLRMNHIHEDIGIELVVACHFDFCLCRRWHRGRMRSIAGMTLGCVCQGLDLVNANPRWHGMEKVNEELGNPVNRNSSHHAPHVEESCVPTPWPVIQSSRDTDMVSHSGVSFCPEQPKITHFKELLFLNHTVNSNVMTTCISFF